MSGSAVTFSVIVPCYGHAAFLPETIESLWAQTFKDFEIIAVVDGSPDNTESVLESMAVASPQPMRVISTRNEGAHAALNTGAELAVGTHLAFANDDDSYHPDRLDVFDRAIRLCDQFLWGFSAVEPMDQDGRTMAASEVPDLGRRIAIQLSGVPLEALKALPRHNAAVSSGNLIIRRDLFGRVGGFKDLRFAHDWDLALRLLAEAPPFIAERRLYRYRIHTGNAFAAQSNRAGARLGHAESAQIIDRQRQREEARVTYGPQVLPPLRVNPDEAFAIEVTLWMMVKLRSAPFFYTAARSVARLLRNVRRR